MILVLPLVEDRVDGDGGLARLPVADDELALPRPIGIIESMALMPVSIGSCTLLRFTMPGALISTGASPSR
jgi:hypothetical protein